MEGFEPWSALMQCEGASAPIAYPLFATADVRAVTSTPERRLRALRDERRIVTLTRGIHVAVPCGCAEGWRPRAEEVGWRFAAARLGLDVPYLSGLSAAWWHGALGSAPHGVHVTVPAQIRTRRLDALGVTVTFHARSETVLGNPHWRYAPGVEARTGADVVEATGEMGVLRVAGRIQTALDLLHSPWRSGNPYEARDAADRLLRGAPPSEVTAIARGQRRHSAAERVDFQRRGRWARDPDLRA